MTEIGLLRIGELGRRAGVSPGLLRAWERRYGLLRPTRSQGGLRLYTDDDLERVLTMQRHLADGLAAAEAAALAKRAPAEPATPSLTPADVRRALTEAFDAFDEPAAQAALDRLLAATTLETALSEVILPYLRELGERWERGEVSVAQEHFASAIVRERLLSLGRGWGRGSGPTALLACLPGERHELGLIAFGLALRSHGWRIAYFGSDTPLETLAATADFLDPAIVVVSAVSDERVSSALADLRALAARHRLALGGKAAHLAGVDELGALRLGGDPVAEAARVAATVTSYAR
jgi:DNA-binding transcriptional MerR regulator